jgi:hypothetical protein
MTQEALLQKIEALSYENEVLMRKIAYMELRPIPFQTRTYIQQLEEKIRLLSKQIETLQKASLRSAQAMAKG